MPCIRTSFFYITPFHLKVFRILDSQMQRHLELKFYGNGWESLNTLWVSFCSTPVYTSETLSNHRGQQLEWWPILALTMRTVIVAVTFLKVKIFPSISIFFFTSRETGSMEISGYFLSTSCRLRELAWAT